MADHSLSMAALRVAVNAPRDGEMRALAQALAASRAMHLDVLNRFALLEDYSAEQFETMAGEIHRLQHEVETSNAEIERLQRLGGAGARLARWAVQRCLAEGVPVPTELQGDIALMLRGGSDDVRMLAPDAAP
jgi:hypothetical protein